MQFPNFWYFVWFLWWWQVGAKSRNISYIKGKLPSWIGIPTSVALPFGVFEKVLSEDSNKVFLTSNLIMSGIFVGIFIVTQLLSLDYDQIYYGRGSRLWRWVYLILKLMSNNLWGGTLLLFKKFTERSDGNAICDVASVLYGWYRKRNFFICQLKKEKTRSSV